MDIKQEIPRLIERIYALEQQMSKMERQLADLTHSEKPHTKAPEPPLLQSTIAERTIPRPASQAKPIEQTDPKSKRNLESVIAGRWLNSVGLLLILIATAFGLKHAFDNDWIGPGGRVTFGVISGAALLIVGLWLRDRGYRYFSDGIFALGGGVLYLSLYAGWDFYKLLSSGQALIAMVAVTAVILWIAERLGSQRVAMMALIGGFLTPMLVSTGQNAEAVLFSYILILDASLLWLAKINSWRNIEPVAFLFSLIYFWGWYGRFYHVSEPLTATLLFASAFFAVFVALPAIHARSRGRISEQQVAQILLNAGNFVFALHSMLWPDHRWALTGAVLGLGALHMLMHAAVPRADEESTVVRMLFSGLALTFVSIAIPIRLEGIWITMAWSIEGAILVWNGFRIRWWFLRAAGFLLFVGVIWRIAVFMPEATIFLFNPRLATFAVAVTSFAAAVYFWRKQPVLIAGNEENIFKFLAIAVNALAIWALSLEVCQYFSNFDDQLGRQLALSILWTTYAGGLLVGGVRRNSAELRWQGLALFGIVVGKVFLYDLSFLSGGYRIVSSIVLGAVLLGVSFLYQRRVAIS